MPTLDPRAGVLGVYDRPPDADTGLRGLPLYTEGGVVDLAVKGASNLTRLRDRISDELEELLGL